MGNHLWTNIGHRKTRRCRGTVKKFAAKLFFQFDLRAYPGLGAVQPIAGIAEAFFLKNAVESLQRQLGGYLHCKSRYLYR